MKQHELISEENGARIDSYVASKLNELSRSRISALLEEGLIIVNDKKVTKSYRLKIHDHITVKIPPPEDSAPAATEMQLDILYTMDMVCRKLV